MYRQQQRGGGGGAEATHFEEEVLRESGWTSFRNASAFGFKCIDWMQKRLGKKSFIVVLIFWETEKKKAMPKVFPFS